MIINLTNINYYIHFYIFYLTCNILFIIFQKRIYYFIFINKNYFYIYNNDNE